MRTVQDRLLIQMVSRRDRFEPSVFELNTFLLFLVSVCPCLSFLQHEDEIQAVRRKLHALVFPTSFT